MVVGVETHGLTGADKALMYALSGVARSAATRSDYISHLPQIILDGVITGSKGWRVLVASLSIQDALNEAANTCTFTVQGARPRDGASIVISYGSADNVERLFAGTVIRSTQVYVGQKPSNLLYQVEGIDWTWGLTARLCRGRYRSQSATTIARDLITKFAPAGFTPKVSEGLPTIDEITVTNVSLMDALTQLAERIGGYAKVDYRKNIWLWITLPPGAPVAPMPLTADHPTLEDVAYTRDLSQIVTRAWVEGGGVNALGHPLGPIPVGETRLPVEDGDWYGLGTRPKGYVAVGPQVLSYTGIVAAGQGSQATSVGGALGATAPGAAPVIGSQSGSGLPSGTYRYAYTWVTAAGECLPSPAAAFANTAASGPAAKPALSAAGGVGLNEGRYRYAYSFVTQTGETLPSPISEVDTGQTVISNPAHPPYLTLQDGQGLPNGSYSYATTFVTAQGETTPGPGASVQTTSQTTSVTTYAPTAAPSAATPTNGPGLPEGRYRYKTTFVTATGETDPCASSSSEVIVPTPAANPTTAPSGTAFTSGAGDGELSYNTTYAIAFCYSLDSATPPQFVTGISPTRIVNSGPSAGFNASGPCSGVNSSGYVHLLCSGPGGSGALHYIKRVADSGINGMTWSSGTGTNLSDADIAALPVAGQGSTSTYVKGAGVMITGIQVGQASVTARNVYRTTKTGSGTYYFHSQLAGNSATSLPAADTKADGSLGAPAPTSNTTTITTTTYAQRVLVENLAIGPPGTTARRLYRTVKGGSQLKLLTTIGNNTQTAFGPEATPDTSLGVNAPTTNTTTIYALQVALSAIVAGPSGVVARNLYRSVAGGTALKRLTSLSNNSTTTYVDSIPDEALGAAPPTVGTAVLVQATIGGILVGPTNVTARKVYRTAANQTQLKLLTTIANNTATTVAGGDVVADGTLGANAPTLDNSGLPSGAGGQVNAGATMIPITATTAFAPEGWALIGDQLIRYTAVTATHLTGVPQSGVGSLTMSIPVGAVVQLVSQLTGIPASGSGAIVEPIAQGDPVNLVVIADDLDAQTALKAVLGGDGVIEGYRADGRVSSLEAESRARAVLDLQSTTRETIRYRCRDRRTQSGLTITVNLPSIGVTGTFQIQDVTISGFLGTARSTPIYDVTASSARYSFEDLLRRRRTVL